MLARAAYGYGVRVYVEDREVGVITSWKAVRLRGLNLGAARTVSFRLVLINPAGEEVAGASFNSNERLVRVT